MKEQVPLSHHRHELYANNRGINSPSPILPMPPAKGLPVKINYYEDVDEPKFDPDIHIQLGKPEYVRCFPKFEKLDKTPCFATDQNGSQFAYSAPFQVLSDEGIEVMKKIIEREKINAIGPKSARGNKMAIRGLYYMSPWVRDLQNCPKLREHFCQIAGEELVPHPSLCNSPQVNISLQGAKGKVDVWHYDSVAYTGVVLLNTVEEMDGGGKLEIMHHEKHEGLDLLSKGKDYNAEAVGYERAGKMILAQGSEILHHVTPVLNDVTRISFIFAFAPANCFAPPKTILKTHQRIDVTTKMANFEYFREKSWQGMNCLQHYVKTVPYTSNGDFLGQKLRVVAEELKRAADILQDIEDDSINIFDERKKSLSTEYDTLAEPDILKKW